MSKKPKLSDVAGVGPKMEEKLREAGFKSPLKLSRADPAKLASKVDGLSEGGAAKMIDAAKELLPDETKAPDAKTKPKTAKKAEPKTATTTPKKKAEPKPKKSEVKKAAPKKKAKPKKETKPKKEAKPKKETKPKKEAKPKKAVKVEDKPEFVTKETLHDKRLLRIAAAKKKRKPRFRHEQAHRWIRVSDSWRKLRGIDNHAREKKKGRIVMVSAGYRSPKAVRGLHPSGYVEIRVERPADLDALDPDVHAIMIGSSVGQRKRQVIITKAETLMLRVLNPGVPEGFEEEELFSELDGLDDLEVD